MKKHFFSLITIFALIGSMIFTGCNSLLNKSKDDAKCSFSISEDVARTIYDDASELVEGEEVLVDITVTCSPNGVVQTKSITSLDDFADLKFTFGELSTEEEYDFDVKVLVNENITLYKGSATKVLPEEDVTKQVSITLEKAYELAKPALTITYDGSEVSGSVRANTGDMLTVNVSPSTGDEYLSTVKTTVTLRGGDAPVNKEVTGNGSVEFEIVQETNYTLFATSNLLDGKFRSGRGEEVSLQVKKQYPTTKYALYGDKVKFYDANSLPTSATSNIFSDGAISYSDFTYDDSGNFYVFATDYDTEYKLKAYKNPSQESGATNNSIAEFTTSTSSVDFQNAYALYDMESQYFYLLSMTKDICAGMSTTPSDITIEKYSTSFNKEFSATISRPENYAFVGRPAVSNNILYVFLADIEEESEYTTKGNVYLAKVDLSTISGSTNTLTISTGEIKQVTLPTGSIVDIDNISSLFRDSIVMDDYLYVLYSDTGSYNGYTSGTDGKTYVRGAVLKFDTATLSLVATSGWTDISTGKSTMTIQKTVTTETESVNYTADFYSPSSDTSGFYGPRRFIAVKPKKLVISDVGLAFYVDETATSLKYNKKIRAVLFDLQDFAIESSSSFSEDSGINFGLAASGIAVSAIAANGSTINIIADSDSGITLVSGSTSTATN